ncbi:hypothetical protein N7468_003611 [Penicillium chermesinum]|uniref:Uncharacterized protein n=1 Tax=Penicillium chermesinum TaxID=63820 RepID=A0A9W9P9L2_9EURO|nr:uncharacterized protein N7468_003611 [Penicillium chermesinum]KAJ5238992.1 hypothetical protein N7468_003611 [Penicillium chermesinum]KAJ6164635.1 hypothetical protein N7470_003307 [Penicillium chermesinum]
MEQGKLVESSFQFLGSGIEAEFAVLEAVLEPATRVNAGLPPRVRSKKLSGFEPSCQYEF